MYAFYMYFCNSVIAREYHVHMLTTDWIPISKRFGNVFVLCTRIYFANL